MSKGKTFVYLNGKIVTSDKACVSVFDRGLNYGDGLFETMRSYDGSPAFLKEHMARLSGGLVSLRIRKGLLKEFLSDIRNGAIEELLRKNGLASADANIKIIVTRGASMGGHGLVDSVPTSIITAKPIDAATVERNQRQGVRAVLVKAHSNELAGIKSLNYLRSVLGKAEAERQRAFECVFTDERSSILEGSSSNVFFVFNGVLATPPEKGILQGVTRKAVLTIAKKTGVKTAERKISVKDVRMASEAFLTNSIMEAVPLTRIGSVTIGNGLPGPVTRAIQSAYREFASP